MRRLLHKQATLLISALAAFSTLGCGGKSSPPAGAQPCIGAACTAPSSAPPCTGLGCTAVTLQSISISPPSSTIAKGTAQPLAATALFSDGSQQDVSAFASCSWTTSDSSVLTLGAPAGGSVTATGASVGTAQVSATYDGVSGSAAIHVTPAVAQSLTVNPPSASVATGVLQTFTAVAHFSDGTDQDISTSASWVSSDGSVASLTSFGVAQGLASGSTTLTASFQGFSALATLEVSAAVVTSLSVAPATASLAAGTTRQLTAIATFSDGSMQNVTGLASWDTSNHPVATVAAGGLVSAATAGPALASANYSGFTASSRIAVTAATLTTLVVTSATPSVPLGVDLPFTAIGIYSDHSEQDLTGQVTWTVLNTSIATVSAGVVHPVAVGGTTVRASVGGVTGETSLTVTDAALQEINVSQSAGSVAKGTTVTFQATGIYSDGSTQDLTEQADWASVPPDALTLSASPAGTVATGIAVGTATVSATFGAYSDTATVTITAAVLRSIAITPSAISIPNGLSQQLTAVGTFSDGIPQDLTAQVAWESSDPEIVAVSNEAYTHGLVTGLGDGGPIDVKATLFGITGSSQVTVTTAVLQTIDVTPLSASVPTGYRAQFSAIATYSDGSSFDVTARATWTSSNTAIVTVSTATGLATGIGPGTASIVANFDGASGQATLTVASATLVKVTVAPNPFTVAAHGTVTLTATGHFSNTSTLDVTSQCVWSSSNKSVAWVSKKGVVTGVKAGTVTITAKKGNRRGGAAGTVQ